MLDFFVDFPPNLNDVQARLFLNDVAVSPWTACVEKLDGAMFLGYEVSFADTAADEIRFRSVSADIIRRYPIESAPTPVDLQPVLDAIEAGPEGWAAVSAKIITLGAHKITVQNSVLPTGQVLLVRGGDHRIADGRAPKFTLEGAFYVALLPSVARWKFIVEKESVLVVSGVAAVVGSNVVVQFPFTRAQTLALTMASGDYYLEAVLNNEDETELPLGQGPFLIQKGGE